MVGLLLIGVAQSWIVVILGKTRFLYLCLLILTLLSGFVFCAAGQGFRMAARSELSLTKNINKGDISRLYIIIFYMDMVGGGLFNAWVLARSFNEGLDHGGVSLGLPLFVAEAEWCIVALIVVIIKCLRNQQ